MPNSGSGKGSCFHEGGEGSQWPFSPHSLLFWHISNYSGNPPTKSFELPPPLLEGGCSLANVVESDKINCSDVLLQVRLLKIRNWQFFDRVFFTSQFIKPLTVLKSSSYRTLTGGASPCTHTAIGSTPGDRWSDIKSRKRYKISKKFLSVGQSTRNGRVHWKENHFQTSQWKSRPRTLL